MVLPHYRAVCTENSTRGASASSSGRLGVHPHPRGVDRCLGFAISLPTLRAGATVGRGPGACGGASAGRSRGRRWFFFLAGVVYVPTLRVGATVRGAGTATRFLSVVVSGVASFAWSWATRPRLLAWGDDSPAAVVPP